MSKFYKHLKNDFDSIFVGLFFYFAVAAHIIGIIAVILLLVFKGV